MNTLARAARAEPASATTIEPSLLDQVIARMETIVERRMAPAVQPMELRSFAELERWAERASRSNMVPKSYYGKPDDIVLAVQMGSELGLRPMQSLTNINVINGRPSVWGDALLGLCKMHPAYVSCEETIAGEGDRCVATCIMVRRGEPPVVRTFSVDDAKVAKLWGKRGRDGQDTPWITNPKRMLQMRARGFAARDAFPDKLRGLISAEEASDYTLDSGGITPAFSATSAAEPATSGTPATPHEPEHESVATMRSWCEAHGETVTQRRFLDALRNELDNAATIPEIDAVVQRADTEKARNTFVNGNHEALMEILDRALERTRDMSTAPTDDFPGVVTPREQVNDDPGDSILPHSPLADLRALMVSCHSIAALDATMRGETWKAALADLVEHERDMLRAEISKRQQQLRGAKS